MVSVGPKGRRFEALFAMMRTRCRPKLTDDCEEGRS